VVAVPAGGDELLREVAFTFAQLDEIDAERELALSEAREEAARIEASAVSERRRILEEAQAEAERVEAEIVASRRASCQEQVESMLVEAGREAERVLARGRQRTPRIVEEVVARLLEDTG
jgi:vacuolar-type H+-ATPase subunit H